MVTLPYRSARLPHFFDIGTQTHSHCGLAHFIQGREQEALHQLDWSAKAWPYRAGQAGRGQGRKHTLLNCLTFSFRSILSKYTCSTETR